MLDDSDLDFAILAWPMGGWLMALVGVVVVVVMAIVVGQNKDECTARKCARGRGVLVSHECMCIEAPEPVSP